MAKTGPMNGFERAAKILEWKRDPVRFVVDVFRAEPDDWQVEFLRAFARQDLSRYLLQACKGPGKSTALAWAGWNFLATRPHPNVVATSVTGENLRDGLWKEFALWRGRSKLLMKEFDLTGSRISYRLKPETWWCSARSFPKEADKTQQAHSLAGLHAKYVLFLLDEMGDYPEGVVDAAEGALSTGVEMKLVGAGNPTSVEGPMYRAATRDRSMWWVKEISGDPTDPKRSKRISVEWANGLIQKHGRDSDVVRVNVLGQFPRKGLKSLIGINEVQRASQLQLRADEYIYAPKILGVDCARYGDDCSVLQPRQGRAAFQAKVFRELSTMELVGQVGRFITNWKPDAVFVDQVGLGAGVVDRLHELGHHSVVGVESGAKAIDSARYANKRAEMWGEMAEWAKNAAIPADAELMGQLTAPTYKFNSNGQLVLESKDDMKKRGLPSPDRGDALSFTFAAPVQAKAPYADAPGFEMAQTSHTVHEYDPFNEAR